MKGKLLLCILGIISVITIPNQEAIAQLARPVPAAYPTINKNYVKVWEASKPGLDVNSILTQLSKDVKQVTQYFDGLGRPLQTVIKEGSLETATNIRKDMVSAIQYDAFGREEFKYLAFPSSTSNGLF